MIVEVDENGVAADLQHRVPGYKDAVRARDRLQKLFIAGYDQTRDLAARKGHIENAPEFLAVGDVYDFFFSHFAKGVFFIHGLILCPAKQIMTVAGSFSIKKPDRTNRPGRVFEKLTYLTNAVFNLEMALFSKRLICA